MFLTNISMLTYHSKPPQFIIVMSNLNILEGVLYTALIVIELLIIKHLFSSKRQSLFDLTHLQKPITRSIPSSTDQQITFAQLLLHFLKMHPFSRCRHKYFPDRRYELLVVSVIASVMICGDKMAGVKVALPIVAVGDLVGIIGVLGVKWMEMGRVRSKKVRANFMNQTRKKNQESFSFHIKAYLYEIIYTLIACTALIAITSKFYNLAHQQFLTLHLEIFAASIAVELLIIRPLTLTTVSLIALALCKHPGCSAVREMLLAAVTTDYEELFMLRQKQLEHLQQLQIKSSQANRRGSELRIQDLNQQQTQQNINGLPIALEQMYHDRLQTNVSPLQNIILITNTLETNQATCPSPYQPEVTDEMQRISPVKVNSANSYRFNSVTIKKDMYSKRNQTANQAINQIQEFRINCDNRQTCDIKEEGRQDNYRTRKDECAETAVATSTETALEIIRKKGSQVSLEPLQEIQFTNITKIDPLSTKPLYGFPNTKRQGERIIGNIIDDETVKAEGQRQGCTAPPPRKKRSRNKRIHVIYTQESSDDDQRDSRSHSAQARSRIANREILIGDEKQNEPRSSFTNVGFNPYFPSKSLNMPVNPMELLQHRNTKQDEPQDLYDDTYERRKRKRKTKKFEQEPVEKSPYLEFLPKMLRKQELQRNHSWIVEPRQKVQNKPANNPSRNSKKQCMQLQIIKKTISSQIDTVYT